jgi:hypothetical protein
VQQQLVLKLEIPIRTYSEANVSEHWFKAAKRHTAQKDMVRLYWLKSPKKGITVPCTVKLTRIGKRLLDSDNLQVSFKWIRDKVADILIPQQAAGQADGDPRITWLYDQRKGPYSIEIEIYKDYVPRSLDDILNPVFF